MKRSDKKKIQYSLAVFVLLTVLVFFLSVLLRNKTDTVFTTQIQYLLDTHSEQTYTVEHPITLDNTISTIGNFYNVSTRQNDNLSACIIRIMGISGPVSMVFLSDGSSTDFIGVAGITLHDSDNKHGISDNQIAYWESTITYAIASYLQNGEHAE